MALACQWPPCTEPFTETHHRCIVSRECTLARIQAAVHGDGTPEPPGFGMTLYAFAEARMTSCDDSGPKAIAMKTSTNLGASWSTVRVPPTHPILFVDRQQQSRESGCECEHSPHLCTPQEHIDVTEYWRYCIEDESTNGNLSASFDHGGRRVDPIPLTSVNRHHSSEEEHKPLHFLAASCLCLSDVLVTLSDTQHY